VWNCDSDSDPDWDFCLGINLGGELWRGCKKMNNKNEPILSPYRWVVLAVAIMAGFIGTYAQFQLPPLAYKLIPALHISSSQFAALMGGPMTGAIFISLLGGTLADRYGVKGIVAVGLSLAFIGCTFRFAVTSFWPFFLLMVLAGLASALLTGNLSKLFGAWFPPEQMGSVVGIYMLGMSLAMFLGTATTPLFPSEGVAFLFSGAVCLVILILWLMLAKNKPVGAPDLPILPVGQYLGKAAQSRGTWLAGACLFFLMGCAMTFTGFLPNVLHDLHGIAPVQAGIYASLATLGGAFGSLIGPRICDRIGMIKPFVVIVCLLGAACAFWSWQAPVGVTLVAALMVAGLTQTAITPTILSMPMLLPEIGPVYAGSAGGIIGTLQVLGAVLLPTFVITPLAGANVTVLYGLAAASFALTIVPVLFLPEVGPKALAARAANATASGGHRP
jgi:MFS family permease